MRQREWRGSESETKRIKTGRLYNRNNNKRYVMKAKTLQCEKKDEAQAKEMNDYSYGWQ